MPNKLPALQYPDRFETRYVSANGGIRWRNGWLNVSIVCAGEYVGLEEIDDGVWDVYFGPLKLGRLLERHMRIEDVYGQTKTAQRVTYVFGLFCYLSPRPLTQTAVHVSKDCRLG